MDHNDNASIVIFNPYCSVVLLFKHLFVCIFRFKAFSLNKLMQTIYLVLLQKVNEIS